VADDRRIGVLQYDARPAFPAPRAADGLEYPGRGSHQQLLFVRRKLENGAAVRLAQRREYPAAGAKVVRVEMAACGSFGKARCKRPELVGGHAGPAGTWKRYS
jgi:hypothetical protein